MADASKTVIISALINTVAFSPVGRSIESAVSRFNGFWSAHPKPLKRLKKHSTFATPGHGVNENSDVSALGQSVGISGDKRSPCLSFRALRLKPSAPLR
jgi:hypothetical protein